jgi:hypothetical protein
VTADGVPSLEEEPELSLDEPAEELELDESSELVVFPDDVVGFSNEPVVSSDVLVSSDDDEDAPVARDAVVWVPVEADVVAPIEPS